MKNVQKILTRSITAALFSAVIAGTWDVWWHGALGRESFFSPPHILLYTSVFVAIVLGFYGWYRTREELWTRLALFITLVPLAAPFDELWHRVFGVESVASPFIIWSPPHIVLILSMVGTFLMLLPLLKKESDLTTRHLFGAVSFAGIFSLLFFLTRPLDPIGPYHLLGFWGAGFVSVVLAWTMLSVKRWMPGTGTAFLFIAFVCLLTSVSSGEQLASNLVVAPHAHPPMTTNTIANTLYFIGLLFIVYFHYYTTKKTMGNSSKVHVWSYWIGIVIVTGSHIYMLTNGLPENQMTAHAVLNLVAVGLIGFAWLSRTTR